MRTCPECNVLLAPKDYKCHVCGTIIAPQKKYEVPKEYEENNTERNIESESIQNIDDNNITIKCPYCNESIKKSFRICPKCDAPLKNGEAIQRSEKEVLINVDKMKRKRESKKETDKIVEEYKKSNDDGITSRVSGIFAAILGVIGLLVWRNIEISIPIHLIGFMLAGVGLKNKKRGFAVLGIVLCVLGCVNDAVVLLGLSVLKMFL